MATSAAKLQKLTVAECARNLRTAMRSGGSPDVAASSQRFFTENIATHGWRTADLRRFARSAQRAILAEGGQKLLLEVADLLFTGTNNDETIAAVLLLESRVSHLADAEFARFDRWLDRMTNWHSTTRSSTISSGR